MILVALFIALTTVGAYISIPLGAVPFTLQTLFVMLSGLLLGSKRGALAMGVYVLMGVIGLPVFANGLSGIGIIFKPTFGYLIGFIPASFIIGLIREKASRLSRFYIAPLVGLLVVYSIGIPYLYYIFNTVIYTGVAIDFATAMKYGFYPFILFDIVKAILAGFVGMTVVPILEKI
jgi:biotin transport system substrate-specific component